MASGGISVSFDDAVSLDQVDRFSPEYIKDGGGGADGTVDLSDCQGERDIQIRQFLVDGDYLFGLGIYECSPVSFELVFGSGGSDGVVVVGNIGVFNPETMVANGAVDGGNNVDQDDGGFGVDLLAGEDKKMGSIITNSDNMCGNLRGI